MNIRKLFILVLLISIVFSIAGVSAADNGASNDIITQTNGAGLIEIADEDINSVDVVSAAGNEASNDIITQSNEADLIEIADENVGFENTEDQELLSEDSDSYVIYVGQNKTSDGGNGTSDNPFNSFELACNNLSGEEKVEINVYNGTYYLNSDLKFNTSNLFITGIGEVIIKNLRNEGGAYASFGLTSSSGNFTFSNLIFNGSNCIYIHGTSQDRYFYVFNGNANLGIFYNCTFTGYNEANMFSSQFNRKFIRCNFLETYNYFAPSRWYNGQIIDFEYCIISNGINLGYSSGGYLNLTYNNVWLGSNRIDEYLYYDTSIGGHHIQAPTNFGRYAVFSAYENYLGNDTYEIIGKLVWNDSTTDGIELLNPMTVEISTRTGNAPNSAILENGTFKVIYKSNSEDNVIEIGLDSQEVILEFKNGCNVIANPINVGDDQIITINLPQTNCILNITVNNKTYEVQSNGLAIFNFTVPDELLEGNYQVNVSIMDSVNHVYGFDSTNWTISRNKQNIIITTPANININDESVNLTILLEKDATGNITVSNGNRNITQEVLGQTTQIDVLSLLSIGENEIEVSYSGDKKYLNQTQSYRIFVNKVYPNINITKPSDPIIDSEINITISLPPNASGNLTIFIGDKNLTISNPSEKNTVDISDFVIAGNNLVTVKYSGDDLWDSQIKKETIYVNKKAPQMSVNITQSAVLIGENITIQISLPQDANGNISVNGNYLFNVIGNATEISIPSLISGINNINITYSGNEKYCLESQIIQVTVERLNISSSDMKIGINYPDFSIELPNDLTGNVTVKINGKTYTQSLIEGSASLKINDLRSGKYTAIVAYEGDNKFNQITKNIEFTVPKPVLKANDLTALYKSGSKYRVHVSVAGSPVVGKTVTFTINGKKTTAVTDNNGYASVKIDLPPKSTKYKVACEYLGVTAVNKIKVNSIIQAKNVKVKKSAKKLKIKVALKKINGKYLKGKKITLKFKGKKYTAKTNKKGVAIFKLNKKVLNKLKVGKKYKYQVSYLKDSVYKKMSIIK